MPASKLCIPPNHQHCAGRISPHDKVPLPPTCLLCGDSAFFVLKILFIIKAACFDNFIPFKQVYLQSYSSFFMNCSKEKLIWFATTLL